MKDLVRSGGRTLDVYLQDSSTENDSTQYVGVVQSPYNLGLLEWNQKLTESMTFENLEQFDCTSFVKSCLSSGEGRCAVARSIGTDKNVQDQRLCLKVFKDHRKVPVRPYPNGI